MFFFSFECELRKKSELITNLNATEFFFNFPLLKKCYLPGFPGTTATFIPGYGKVLKILNPRFVCAKC